MEGRRRWLVCRVFLCTISLLKYVVKQIDRNYLTFSYKACVAQAWALCVTDHVRVWWFGSWPTFILFAFEAPSSLAGVNPIILLGQIVGCWVWVFLQGGECDCTFGILHESRVQDNPQYVTLLKSAVTKSLFTNITMPFYWLLQEITALSKCVVAFAKMTRVGRFLIGNFRFRG